MKFLSLPWAALCAVAALFPATANAQTRALSNDLTNIAAAQNGGRVLGSSSTFNNDKNYSASNLIDGQVFNSTRAGSSKGWASNQFDPLDMDTITLGFAGNATRKIGKIVLNPTVDLTTERWAKDVEVQVSTESAEGPYQAVAQLTLKRAPEAQEFAILPVPARFVRLMFRSNWGSDRAVALGEVEIYEAIDSSDPMGSLITRLESALTDLRRYQQVQSEGGFKNTAGAPLSNATVKTVQLLGGEARAGSLNIAAAKNGGKVMAYSSTFDNDPAYSPNNLIDGSKTSNGWASQGFAPGKEFVTLGFADDRTKLIGKITLNPKSNQADLRWARRVEVEVTSGSFKDGPWKKVTSLNVRSEAVNQDFAIRPVEAKYVRFTFQANGPGVILPDADPNVNSDRAVSLGEIEIYEPVAGNDQLESLIGRFNGVLVDLKSLRSRQIADGKTVASKAPRAAKASKAKTNSKPAKKNFEEAALKPSTRSQAG